MVQTGMLRGFGGRLRQVLRLAMGDRIRAFASGLAVTALLQSSTETGLMLAGFLDRGFVALPMALAAILGANVGATLIVQLLAFDISAVIPILILRQRPPAKGPQNSQRCEHPFARLGVREVEALSC